VTLSTAVAIEGGSETDTILIGNGSGNGIDFLKPGQGLVEELLLIGV
jgi:hypothetical protein